MTGKEKVTVCISCYNQEKFIGEAIDSVVNQSYANTELIVVDDCSTDKSLEEIYSKKTDKNMTVISHQENSGNAAKAFRGCIERATGDFILMLRGDDMLSPEAISKQIGIFKDPRVSWVAPDIKLIGDNGRTIEVWNNLGKPVDPLSAVAFGFMQGSMPAPKNGLVRMSFLQSNKLSWYEWPDVKSGDDAATCCKWLECFPMIRLLPEPLYYYRVHGGNVTGSSAIEKAKKQIALKEYVIEHYSEAVYLWNPVFMRHEYGGPEYMALKYFLIAEHYHKHQAHFRMPDYFSNRSYEDELEAVHGLFQDRKVHYAKLSLEQSPTWTMQLEKLSAF